MSKIAIQHFNNFFCLCSIRPCPLIIEECMVNIYLLTSPCNSNHQLKGVLLCLKFQVTVYMPVYSMPFHSCVTQVPTCEQFKGEMFSCSLILCHFIFCCLNLEEKLLKHVDIYKQQ